FRGGLPAGGLDRLPVGAEGGKSHARAEDDAGHFALLQVARLGQDDQVGDKDFTRLIEEVLFREGVERALWRKGLPARDRELPEEVALGEGLFGAGGLEPGGGRHRAVSPPFPPSGFVSSAAGTSSDSGSSV